MMTPKFIDVVEYVRTGEDDPEMKELLEQHPDGAELLKQARFITKMLERQIKESDFPGRAAGLDMLVASMKAPSAPRRSRTVFQHSIAEMRSESVESARSLRDDGRRRSEDLGTLEFTQEGERIAISYEPSKAAMRYLSKPKPEFALSQPEIEGIEIRGATTRIFLPDTVAAGEALPLRLAHGARQMPAVGRKMIFMPESGPFVSFAADEEGKVQFPIPEDSGTLRIDAGVTQVLHIKRKK
jgi:hypothetical protein